MRVAFKQDEKSTGLIFKKPEFVVTCTVEFSEEEKRVIKLRKMERTILDSYTNRNKTTHLVLQDFMKQPHVKTFRMPSAAKDYEVFITEKLSEFVRNFAH